jgi:hypothetical protein
MPITCYAYLNKLPVTLEFPDSEIIKLRMAALDAPEDLNQKQAAAYCGTTPRTFRKWNVPTNENGRYSVEVLKARMNTAGVRK